MDEGQGSKRVAQRFQGSRVEVEQLDGGEAERERAAPEVGRERARPPGRVIVAKDGQAHHWYTLPVKNSGVVEKHPLGEHCVVLALDFDMNEHQRWAAVPTG